MNWENDIKYSSPNCPKCGCALADSGALDAWGADSSVKICFCCKSAFRMALNLRAIGTDGKPSTYGPGPFSWVGDGWNYTPVEVGKEGQ